MTMQSGTESRRRIRKDVLGLRVVPNLLDYEAAYGSFDWDDERRLLSGLPGGGLNIAYEAVDRHAAGLNSGKDALRFVRSDGSTENSTFAMLAERTNRFASVLRTLGIQRGDRVFSLLGRRPELYTAALGTLKNGSVFCPLFSAFGPAPISERLTLGSGRVLVTTLAYRKKVAPLRPSLPTLVHVLIVDGEGSDLPPRTRSLPQLMREADPVAPLTRTEPEDMALLHFTSGTTGRPKGAIHVHEAVVAHSATGRLALDLHPDDVYWCTADPGWVTGTSYGIIAPLVQGVTTIVDEEELDAER